MNNKITVEIYGETYPVKGADDLSKVMKTAKYLDERMKSTAKANPHLSPLRVAILTALNITDNYLSLEKDYHQIIQLIKEEKG